MAEQCHIATVNKQTQRQSADRLDGLHVGPPQQWNARRPTATRNQIQVTYQMCSSEIECPIDSYSFNPKK